jgi:hypothetical protein
VAAGRADGLLASIMIEGEVDDDIEKDADPLSMKN